MTTCPDHPLNILPASSKRKERSSYLLLLRDFVSHITIKRICIAPSFLKAKRIKGNFSSLCVNIAPETDSISSINNLSTLSPNEFR